MDKYYHYTSDNCFNSIVQNGLTPQRGIRCQTINDTDYGVFMSKGIDESIKMYAFMYSFYNKFVGYEGDKLIEENKIKKQQISKNENHGLDKLHDIITVKQLESEIKKVCQIRSYLNFFDYLGGTGRYLSINGLYGVDDSVPHNCCYNGVVPPYMINLITIRNKLTNVRISSREVILSYFMSMYPIEEVLKKTTDETKDQIYQLYDYVRHFHYDYYNPYYYDLEEIPISYYDCGIPKEKTLVHY